MKIVLLQGLGEVGKRNEILRIKKQFSPEDISTLSLKEKDLRDLKMLLSSPSFFGSEQKLIVAEDVPEILDLETILRPDEGMTLVLVASQPKFDSALLTSARKIGVKTVVFEGEKEVSAFPFLDNLIEGRKEAFVELEKLFAGYGGMYILAMIYYLLRRNLLPLPQGEFIRRKIEGQRQGYTKDDFERFYYLTLQTEAKIKSGSLEEKLGLTRLTADILKETGELRD